jgi:hypothetical protein
VNDVYVYVSWSELVRYVDVWEVMVTNSDEGNFFLSEGVKGAIIFCCAARGTYSTLYFIFL